MTAHVDNHWLPHIDRQRCTGCGQCVAHCPTGALKLHGGTAALAHPEACTYCLACEDVCPTAAIDLPFLIYMFDNPPPST
ncbi:MAG: 4Fe-4S binding protein [Anaerolineae bacterium]|nr:4Fe-4S binding protein [Anaerolineae bacterium]